MLPGTDGPARAFRAILSPSRPQRTATAKGYVASLRRCVAGTLGIRPLLLKLSIEKTGESQARDEERRDTRFLPGIVLEGVLKSQYAPSKGSSAARAGTTHMGGSRLAMCLGGAH